MIFRNLTGLTQYLGINTEFTLYFDSREQGLYLLMTRYEIISIMRYSGNMAYAMIISGENNGHPISVDISGFTAKISSDEAFPLGMIVVI